MPKGEREAFKLGEKRINNKEKEISLEEKAETIRKYINEDYSDSSTMKKKK